MAIITGLTAARMLLIEAASVVSGAIVGDNLVLTKHDGSTINAGNVRGPKGDQGDPGSLTGPLNLAGSDINGILPKARLDPAVTNYIFGPGFLADYAGLSAPAGWLICDGSEVSRTEYAALFAAISTLYGEGNGTTTFNLPDAQDRASVGASGTKDIGSTGGSETTVLTVANLPPHQHSMHHEHESNNSNDDGNSVGFLRRGGGATGPLTHPGAIEHFSGNTGSGSGSSAPINTQSPYLAVTKIIKT